MEEIYVVLRYQLIRFSLRFCSIFALCRVMKIMKMDMWEKSLNMDSICYAQHNISLGLVA